MNKSSEDESASASENISQRIESLGGWRGKTLARMRKLIKDADPDVVETWKWMGTPIWEHDGIICTGESYKDKIKLTFAKGASLKDPKKLFNSSLEGNVRRALDIMEGDEVDATAFKALVREAIALNESKAKKPVKKAATQPTAKTVAKPAKKTVAKTLKSAAKTVAKKSPKKAAKKP